MAELLGELRDSELIALIQLGSDDEQCMAFSVLFVRYGERLQKDIFFTTGSRGFSSQEREDVASETWVRAWCGIKSFEDRGVSVLTWLKKIALNVVNRQGP